MFGSLKEKLKNWIKKNKEPPFVEEPKEEEKQKEKILTKIPTKKEPISKQKKEREKEKKREKEKTSFFKRIFQKEKLEKETEEIKEDIEEKNSFFQRCQRTVDEEKFEELFSELELILLQSNVALETVDSIKSSLKKRLIGKILKEVNLEEELKNSIKEILINPPNFLEKINESLKEKSPFVILFAGINGAGKTTTIAKIANYLQKNNLSVCLAAADTFRAASIEQLKEHAEKLKVHLISKDYGSDPASVGFDAISYAKKNKINVVLIDTAGRLQNKDSLMKEIEKISRVNKPDMKIFLGESITGNDCLEQARVFNEVINLTGIILSKADVDEKGGTAISVSNITKKPIYFLGTGQSYDDLEVFDKDKVIKRIGF